MTKTDPGTIPATIADLTSADRGKREQARQALEDLGAAAVQPLIEALSPREEKSRHEILKVLGAIADPAATGVFLAGLEDDSSDCRWVAAEGLVSLGREGLVTVLNELTEYPATERKLRGTHHVLSGLRNADFNDIVAPVLRAFLSDVSHIDLPRAAVEALAKLRH